MYVPAPNEEELASFGLTLDDVAMDPIVIWPDNLQAFEVFAALSTQWRSGMGGPTGLDYSVLPEVWRRTKTPKADRDDVFESLRIMEGAALEEMGKK